MKTRKKKKEFCAVAHWKIGVSGIRVVTCGLLPRHSRYHGVPASDDRKAGNKRQALFFLACHDDYYPSLFVENDVQRVYWRSRLGSWSPSTSGDAPTERTELFNIFLTFLWKSGDYTAFLESEHFDIAAGIPEEGLVRVVEICLLLDVQRCAFVIAFINKVNSHHRYWHYQGRALPFHIWASKAFMGPGNDDHYKPYAQC